MAGPAERRSIHCAGPTGREKPGEHWNARIIREENAALLHEPTDRELLELPAPPVADSWVETSTNGAGQRVYRVVTVSRWEVIPGR